MGGADRMRRYAYWGNMKLGALQFFDPTCDNQAVQKIHSGRQDIHDTGSKDMRIKDKMLSAICAIAIVVSAGVAHAKVTKGAEVHLTAETITTAFGANSMAIPKMYVFFGGRLVYETPHDPEPGNKALMRAIQKHGSGKLDAATSKHGMIVKSMLKSSGVDLNKARGVTIVSYKLGKTIGDCSACDEYYPVIRNQLDKIAENVTWDQIIVEKNNYKKKH